MKIKVGFLLRKKRKELNLNQESFVGNIISISQYSRIEQGKQDIKFSDLLNILIRNKIGFSDFFSNIENVLNIDNAESEQKLFSDLAQSYYDDNIERVKEIKAEIHKKGGFENKLWELRAELMIAVMNNSLSNVNPKLINQISEELNKSDDWTTDKNFLQLFGSSMLLFDIHRLNIYMKKIIITYQDSLRQKDFTVQRRIAGICINYLTRSYKDKSYDYVIATLQLLNNLAQNPDLLMYKMLGVYFDALFSNKENEVKQIRNLLNKSGYSEFLVNLP